MTLIPHQLLPAVTGARIPGCFAHTGSKRRGADRDRKSAADSTFLVSGVAPAGRGSLTPPPTWTFDLFSALGKNV
jgi:hypothetical protein